MCHGTRRRSTVYLPVYVPPRYGAGRKGSHRRSSGSSRREFVGPPSNAACSWRRPPC